MLGVVLGFFVCFLVCGFFGLFFCFGCLGFFAGVVAFCFCFAFFLFGWGFLVVGLLGFLRLVLLDLG